MMGEEHYRAWGELLHSINTGECAFEHAYGKNIFDYLASHPEQGKTFDAAMTGIHGRESAAMLDVFDFSDVGLLADVGGGNGSLLAATLNRYPRLQGLLFDMPESRRSRRGQPAIGRRRPALPSGGRQLFRGNPRRGRRLSLEAHHPRLG